MPVVQLLCTALLMQADNPPIQVRKLDLLIDSLGKFDYGPVHVSSNHLYTYMYVCQQKQVDPMEIPESSYKGLNSCFVAIASFHNVKQLSCVLKKNGCGS